ncbi:PIN domain-containing protein [Deltaproteobacteria bacterium TL4]
MKETFVVDSSLFNKLYLNEQDRDKAVALFQEAALHHILLVASTLLFYEVMATAQAFKLSVEKIVQLLNKQKAIMPLIEPTMAHVHKGVEIVKKTICDQMELSIYEVIPHAIALVENYTFVTADKQYFARTQHFENIVLIESLSFRGSE